MARQPQQDVTLTPELRDQLTAMVRSRSLPQGLTRRARIVLMAAEGMTNSAISTAVGLSRPSVIKWRKRFIDQGLMGLYEELRPGAPRTIDDDQIARLIRQTLETRPNGATHWSCRLLSRETGLSKSTVQRVWSTFGLQPHRQKHFKLSTDPFFVEKVRDIVGLYLNPPPTRPWCSASTRRVKCRPWSEHNRSCPWAWATSKG